VNHVQITHHEGRSWHWLPADADQPAVDLAKIPGATAALGDVRAVWVSVDADDLPDEVRVNPTVPPAMRTGAPIKYRVPTPAEHTRRALGTPDPAGHRAEAALAAVIGVVTVDDAAKHSGFSRRQLIDEAQAWAAAR
jgi:hypothetical protein